MTDAEPTADFRVLFVCTGNLCRSPMAERLLRRRTADAPWLAVDSAGTAAPTGAPMDPASQAALERLGGSGFGFAATRLSAAAVQRADLILAMAREHRAAVARLAPAATRRAFALTEFGRLAAGVAPGDGTVDGARRVVGSVRAQRGIVPPVPGEWDDIVDPIGRPAAVVERCAAQIAELVDGLSAMLGLRR